MGDYLVKALAFDDTIRAYAVNTTETVREAQKRQDTWPTASAALGRTLTAGVMIGAMLKGEDRVTIKINGGGPLGTILVDANAKGEVRGYVTNPHVDFELNEKGKLDVARAVGKNGMLVVIKDIGLKEYFSGQVPIISGEIGEDFTYYFAASEQIPSSVGVGVLVDTDYSIKASGGFIIQVLPGASDEMITKIEENLGKIKPVSTLIDEGVTPEELLELIIGKNQLKILEKLPVSYTCNCSKERYAEILIGLGAAELEAMIEEDGQAEVQCHFCNEKYHYSWEELEQLQEKAREIEEKRSRELGVSFEIKFDKE